MNLRKFLGSQHGAALLVALFSFAVYLSTLAPSVSFIDSGELSAVAYILGVAHPTGYPLFTLIGWIFSHIPFPFEEVVRLNMMAALFCSLGIFIFYHLMSLILSMVAVRMKSMKGLKGNESSGIAVASAGAALLLAFSETYWQQALSVEVYSLHVMFLALVSYCFLRAIFFDEKNSGGVRNIWWSAFGFTLGLSFTNHMTTILLAPGFVYLYFATQGWNKTSWRRIGLLAVPFLVGLSVYLYLPVRAAQSPPMNWGDPETLERFLWHISGKQYRVWIKFFSESAGKQFNYFLTSLPWEFAYIGLGLAAIGIIALWRASRKLAIAVLLLFFGCIFYSINYDIHDIDSYFLLAYLAMALMAGCGLFVIFSWLRSHAWQKQAAVGAVLLLSLIPLAVHYNKTDESDNYLVEDYTMNMFSSLERNALVLSFQWDYWVSASYYYQLVRHYRPDVVVVDKELLRRSWYLKELAVRYPWLIHRSKGEVDAFLKELYKFEHDLPYNPAVIQARYVEMIASMISQNIPDRPVYVTPEIEAEFTKGYQLVPSGLAKRLHGDTSFHDPAEIDFRYRPFERRGRLEDVVRNLYVGAFVAKGAYLAKAGRRSDAEQAFRKALQFDPQSPEALAWLSRVGG